MIPFGHETVTLVRRGEAVVNGRTAVTYSVETLTGCSWRRTPRIARVDNALLREEGVTCRVPAGQAVPRPGDLLILGEVSVSVNSGADYNRLVEQYRECDGAFVAASVQDNARRGMPLAHYAARS